MTKRSQRPKVGDVIRLDPRVIQFTLRGNRLDTDGPHTVALRRIVPGECFLISDQVDVLRNLYWAPVQPLKDCADLARSPGEL